MGQIKGHKVWRNGELIDWDDARVHVISHGIHYGTNWFEGIRCYKTGRGSEIFRLREHVQRLFNSCKIYRTEIPYSTRQIEEAIIETVAANGFEHCYIRPLVMSGEGTIAISPSQARTETYILAWEWGTLLGEEALEKGVRVCVSSWRRAAPDTFPTVAKAAGNYLSGALVHMEAESLGFDEAIALDVNGLVSEGSGENLFMVRQGRLYTPQITNAILPGLTRDSVLTLASDLGLSVEETPLARETLYLADELFLTGTAAEITPIRSVDDITIGSGRRGPVTERLQVSFFDIVRGRVPDRHQWMTPVSVARTQQASSASTMGEPR